MKYISTRGGIKPVSFSEAVMMGLADDGGLLIPNEIPKISQQSLEEMSACSYNQLAFKLLPFYIDDISLGNIGELVNRTYTDKAFQTPDITPLRRLGPNRYLLDLSQGPTLAFKDVALQFLGNLFEYLLAKNGGVMNILGATSGDTGSAAIYGVRGKKGINIFMLSPLEGMSDFQAAQMRTVMDQNVFNIAVRGVFDDCQDMVKAVNDDLEFKTKHSLGAVNSINWARVAAQVVYYFKGYFAAIKSSGQKVGDQVDFAVPTGNFGNILAGYYAKEMGLPIRHLILATNENDVLDQFFKTGVYRPRKTDDVVQTTSPSMDISKASNFERFLYYMVGQDPKAVQALMYLSNHGGFNLADLPSFRKVEKSGFVSGRSTGWDRQETIRDVYSKRGYIIDGHTADGVKVGFEYFDGRVPLVCLETAKAAKFKDLIQTSLGRDPEIPAPYKDLTTMSQRFETIEKGDVEGLKRYVAERALKSF
jgi:threonine synthase